MDVQFGTTTSYGLNTWQVPTPSANGGDVQIYVAGMLGQTLYHMRAQVTLNNGATYNDADHTCTTGTPPPTSPVNVTTTNGATPQPGIEMWNTILPVGDSQAFATDLNGNVIWTYSYSPQFKRLHPGHPVVAQRQSADGDLVPLLHDHGRKSQRD